MSSPKITNVPFRSLSRVICGQNFCFLPLTHSSFVTRSSNFCHWCTHSLLSTSAPMVPYQLSHTVHPSINSVYELTTYINLLNVWSHWPWSYALLHSVHRSSYNFSVPSHCMNWLENLPWPQQWLYTFFGSTESSPSNHLSGLSSNLLRLTADLKSWSSNFFVIHGNQLLDISSAAHGPESILSCGIHSQTLPYPQASYCFDVNQFFIIDQGQDDIYD